MAFVFALFFALPGPLAALAMWFLFAVGCFVIVANVGKFAAFHLRRRT